MRQRGWSWLLILNSPTCTRKILPTSSFPEPPLISYLNHRSHCKYIHQGFESNIDPRITLFRYLEILDGAAPPMPRSTTSYTQQCIVSTMALIIYTNLIKFNHLLNNILSALTDTMFHPTYADNLTKLVLPDVFAGQRLTWNRALYDCYAEKSDSARWIRSVRFSRHYETSRDRPLKWQIKPTLNESLHVLQELILFATSVMIYLSWIGDLSCPLLNRS